MGGGQKMIFQGVIPDPNMSPLDKVAQIATHLGVNISPSDLEDVVLLRPRQNSNRPPLLLVKFTSRKIKTSKYDHQIIRGLQNSLIFINEDLTPARAWI